MADKNSDNLDNLLNSIRNEEEGVPEGLDDLLNDIRSEGKTSVYKSEDKFVDDTQEKLDEKLSETSDSIMSEIDRLIEEYQNKVKNIRESTTQVKEKIEKKSAALAVIPKRVEQVEEELINEDIDPEILELLGIDDPTGLDYSDYKSLLKEKMVANQMGSGLGLDQEKLKDEFKRVRGKTGKFTVKNQKIKAETFVSNKKKPTSSARVVTPIPLLPGEIDEDIQPERQSFDKTIALLAGKLNSVDSNVKQTTENLQKKDAVEAKQNEQDRITAERTANNERETRSERRNLLVGAVGGIKKSVKPVTDLFDGFFDFLKRLGFAVLIMELLKFLEDPAKYINGIVKFINKQIENLEDTIENFVINRMIKPLNGQIEGLNKNIQNFVKGVNKQLDGLRNIPGIGNKIPTLSVPEIPKIKESIVKDKVYLGRVPEVKDDFLSGILGAPKVEPQETLMGEPKVEPQETLMGEPKPTSDEMGSNVFDTIVSGEGDVNSVNRGVAGDTPGGAKSIFGKDLTEMTVGEIMDAQAKGNVFAVGKYQIIPSTMKEFVDGSDVKRSDKFTEATQDKFRDYVINVKRPEVGRYIRGETDDPTEAGQALAREFASVGLQYAENNRRRGQGRYDGDSGGNKASISPEEITEALKRDRKSYLKPSTTEGSTSTSNISSNLSGNQSPQPANVSMNTNSNNIRNSTNISPPVATASMTSIGGLGGGETPSVNTTSSSDSQSRVIAFSASDPTNLSILAAKSVYRVVG